MLHLHQAKGAKDRRIPISDSLLYRLRVYWQSFHPITHLFFKPIEDKPLNKPSLQKAYYKAKKEAGILKQGSIHALCHAFPIHQLMAGMPLIGG